MKKIVNRKVNFFKIIYKSVLIPFFICKNDLLFYFIKKRFIEEDILSLFDLKESFSILLNIWIL